MVREGLMISGRYEIIGQIGTGGMADVYKAIDRILNRYVAVKVLKSEFREDELFVKKFRSEAQAAAGLMHPNIVNVYDVGEDQGLYYIVMELVEGISLKEYIQKKGHLSAKETIAIATQVCLGIDVAHTKGIVHRDIKPQNIIISKEGKVKVTDFGIAKATSSNTISTNAMGSVHYTSPEQARGGFSDPKSDIYSLGITMYEMVTGILPFDGESTVSIALKHLQEDIVPPSEHVPEIPYSLEQIIIKCTQKSPDRRYQDVTSLIRDLKHSLQDPDGDFVRIAPHVSMADTVIIGEEDLEQIQKASSEYDYDEEESYSNDDYDYDYDDDDEEEYERKGRKSKKNSDIDPKMAKIMKILTIVVSAIFIFILLFVIGKGVGIIKIGPGIISETDEILVPNLVGKTQSEAEKLCEEEGLVMEVVGEVESEQYEAGLIDSQKTQAGTEVQENFKVQVYVSSGLKGKEIIIPMVIGSSKEVAIETLMEAGFLKENITVNEVEHATEPKGNVVSITPEENSSATEKTQITLEVSKGPGQTIVPSLEGKTKEEALKAITDANLVGSYEEVYHDSVASGKVIDQDLAAGEKVNKGTTVKYTVSKGPEPAKMVTVPSNLVGTDVSSAKATILNLKLVPQEKYESSTQYNEGYVISVDKAGQSVEEGSSVVITISTGPGPVQEETPPTDTPSTDNTTPTTPTDTNTQ